MFQYLSNDTGLWFSSNKELRALFCYLCLFSDYWNDLQHGPVLCYQEQQRSYIGGRSDPLNHPLTQQQPDPYTYAQTLHNQCLRIGRAAAHLHVCDTLFRSGGEVNCTDCIQHDTLDHFKTFPMTLPAQKH